MPPHIRNTATSIGDAYTVGDYAKSHTMEMNTQLWRPRTGAPLMFRVACMLQIKGYFFDTPRPPSPAANVGGAPAGIVRAVLKGEEHCLDEPRSSDRDSQDSIRRPDRTPCFSSLLRRDAPETQRGDEDGPRALRRPPGEGYVSVTLGGFSPPCLGISLARQGA